jgi:hypothetical protein
MGTIITTNIYDGREIGIAVEMSESGEEKGKIGYENPLVFFKAKWCSLDVYRLG